MPRKNIIAIALMAVAVIFLIVRFSTMRPAPPPEPAPAPAKAGVPAKAPVPTAKSAVESPEGSPEALSNLSFEETNALLDELSSFVYDPFTLKDPMRPLIAKVEKSSKTGAAKSALASAVLGGIVWTEKHPLALVDNQVVGEGDYIGEDILVAKITKEKVVLRRGEEEAEIFLEEE